MSRTQLYQYDRHLTTGSFTKAMTAIVIIFLCSCRQEYNPPVISSTRSYLVVEGVLAIGPDSTIIHLTRTFKLSDTARVKAEKLAKLQVEKDDNSVYLLTETGNGYYSSPNLNLQANGKYRLRIKTADGKEYLSDYVVAKNTPPIDSVGWTYDAEGVKIYANTHDPANNTRYYRWDYDETWEIHSTYFNYLKLVNGVYVPRILPAEDVSVCWLYGNSQNILIGSSAQLQSDIIHEAPIAFIPRMTDKIGVRYSMLLKQYAIDKEAYDFFDQMKKNTENIGTFFDPQPSEISGNIHCLTTPGETVIGYITAASIQRKRIFIAKTQVDDPVRWNFMLPCDQKDVTALPDSMAKYIPPWVPYELVVGFPNFYYSCSFPQCIDCTQRGGLTAKPSYW